MVAVISFCSSNLRAGTMLLVHFHGQFFYSSSKPVNLTKEAHVHTPSKGSKGLELVVVDDRPSGLLCLVRYSARLAARSASNFKLTPTIPSFYS